MSSFTQNLDTMRYLGFITHNCEGVVHRSAERTANALSRTHGTVGGIMAGTIIGTEYCKAIKEIDNQMFPPFTRVQVRNASFNKVCATGTVKRHVTSNGRNALVILNDETREEMETCGDLCDVI